MKKNPAIKEDNKERQFASVQRVVINNTSSGTSLWVPEETSETDELTVTENGVYCAYDDNVFGYSKIIVNVSESLNDRSEKDKAIGKITGTNPDTGDTESYGVDENGNLTKDVIPSGLPQAIHIVIEPRKKVYDPGETLDFSGIHVYLLDGEGHQWTSDEYPTGEIPFDELIFPVTAADGGQTPQSYVGTYNNLSVGWSSSISGTHDGSFPFSVVATEGSDVRMFISHISENYPDWMDIHICSKNDYAQYVMTFTQSTGDVDVFTQQYNKQTYTVDNTTIYFFNAPNIEVLSSSNLTNLVAYGTSFSDAVKAVYSSNQSAVGGEQEIPVQWVRAEDGRTLEDTYMITINAESPSENESGGSSSGGEHSGGDF